MTTGRGLIARDAVTCQDVNQPADLTCIAAGHIIAAKRPAVACLNPIEIVDFSDPTPRYLCGCSQCPAPARLCVCGHAGTHRPEPGIGCTHPACLCLEPAQPTEPPRPRGGDPVAQHRANHEAIHDAIARLTWAQR